MQPTRDLNVVSTLPLTTPAELVVQLPMTERANATVVTGRAEVRRILDGSDARLLVVVGPCSIHDPDAALEYTDRLTTLSRRLDDRLLVVMRVYFEKPRTIVGWKGLINDPYLDGTFDIAAGLRKARELLLAVTEMGMPAGTELLEPITPQYVADLVSWGAIGARTTESQTHRQMASGLSMPLGCKNGTDGNLDSAINALKAAGLPHSFLGIDADGRTCVVKTKGNPWSHLILRGGRSGTNFDEANVRSAGEALTAAGLPCRLMVDCSHANADKDFRKQALAFRDVLAQRSGGNRAIIGVMLESNIEEGSQKLGSGPLRYGVSITDGCIGWAQTEELLEEAHAALADQCVTMA